MDYLPYSIIIDILNVNDNTLCNRANDWRKDLLMQN